MTRWQEVDHDRRHRLADEGHRQPPGALDALLGTGAGGARASGSEQDPDEWHGASSTARADTAGAGGPDHEAGSGRGPEEEPPTAVTEPVGMMDPWYRRARTAFSQWRRTRPFWAGLLCLLGGALMAFGPLSVFRYVLVAGTVIWAGVLIGLLVCTMGLFLWLTPQFRQIVGILAVVFSIVSLITSNLGGFILGLLLGSLGGAMGFAWTPLPMPAEVGSGTAAPSGERQARQQQADHGADPTGPGAAALDATPWPLYPGAV